MPTRPTPTPTPTPTPDPTQGRRAQRRRARNDGPGNDRPGTTGQDRRPRKRRTRNDGTPEPKLRGSVSCWACLTADQLATAHTWVPAERRFSAASTRRAASPASAFLPQARGS
ncbi:hypothetical protein CIK73_10105 [Brachybacterium alimentarium]|nr:hypothetical protein CIK73_10105 [Brachybacterium alimentarium]RCS76680.1 hypothetical protein CIK68_01390 [Brachybacterium alimentarium]RCS83294.1 hypothetical protein CIK67_12605 [Brachybacterium alimentarium]RCS91120.1 hypothetical protein CIK69_05735 [Brachybacterium alimentarium]